MVKRDLRTKSKSIHSAITITIAHSDKSRSAMRREPRGKFGHTWFVDDQSEKGISGKNMFPKEIRNKS